MNQVLIIDTGIANTASVRASFERIGCGVTITRNAGRVRDAEYVVLPGVGSFGAGMNALRSSGLDRVVIDRVKQNQPLLGICLGLQLLCASSEEAPEITGLGVIDASVTRFPDSVMTPQHGWNRVGDGYAYFSNTYRIESITRGWTSEMSDHGGPFVASLQRGKTLACQFHPELSGEWGERVLGAWLNTTREVSSC